MEKFTYTSEDENGEEKVKSIPAKIRVTFKTPDAVYNAINKMLPDEDRDDQELISSISEKMSTFVEWGEFITIEFDVIKNTAEVIRP